MLNSVKLRQKLFKRHASSYWTIIRVGKFVLKASTFSFDHLENPRICKPSVAHIYQFHIRVPPGDGPSLVWAHTLELFCGELR